MSPTDLAPLIVLPDMVELCIDYLSARPEVLELLGGDSMRIANKSPKDVSSLWVRVSRVGGPPTEYRRFDSAYMQFDAFGVAGGDGAVMTLARTVHAAMWAARNWDNGKGLITSIGPQLGIMGLFDTTRTPPTPRVYFGVVVKARPV
jgi:hypothetical protein